MGFLACSKETVVLFPPTAYLLKLMLFKLHMVQVKSRYIN